MIIAFYVINYGLISNLFPIFRSLIQFDLYNFFYSIESLFFLNIQCSFFR